MYLKKKVAFRVFAFRKTPKRKKTRKNVILKLHFPDVVHEPHNFNLPESLVRLEFWFWNHGTFNAFLPMHFQEHPFDISQITTCTH